MKIEDRRSRMEDRRLRIEDRRYNSDIRRDFDPRSSILDPPSSTISDGEVLLRAVDLTKIYSGRAEEVVVFRDLNLEVARGEMVAVTGESGVGKSTLLHLLGG